MEPTQLLAPDGLLLPGGYPGYQVGPQNARAFYRQMVLGRRFDEEAMFLQRRGELGLWLQSLGQEAAQIGSVNALSEVDYVFPSYREHCAALARGIDGVDLVKQWRGVTNSGWDPRAHRFHIYTLVLAAQTLHATGYARAKQLDGSQEVVLVYFGDGAASEGDANEALNIAAVWNCPIVFFCQNNQWAISTPNSRQHKAPIHQRAAGFGLKSAFVDGNDVFAVHAVTKEAVDHARAGRGPVLIEAVTYRMAGHSTTDNPRKYRAPAEVEQWRARDPIDRVRRLLETRDWADKAFFGRLDQEADELVRRVRRECLELQPVDASLVQALSAGIRSAVP